MRTSIKPLIRRIVLTTCLPPFAKLYNFYYWLVSRIVLRTLKKFSGVKAVYLRRGFAKGELLPGLSDIDLTVIERGMTKEDKQSLHSSYQRIKRLTTILDRHLVIQDEETFYKNYQKTNKRFRMVEGKDTWKLIYGKDYLAELPQLPIEGIYGSFYSEIKYWWTIFCRRLVQLGKDHDEEVIRNSVCYKTVSEILKMCLAFQHDMIIFDRGEALKLAKGYVSKKELVEVERLETIAKKRFAVSDINIAEDTKNFLLIFLDRFHKDLIQHEYARPSKNITQRVDCLKDEMLYGWDEYSHVTRLMDYAKNSWSDCYRGAYLVSGVFFELDELALLLEVDPARPPKLTELTALYCLHSEAQPGLKSRLHLYILMPNTAFKIDAEHKNVWHSILSAFSNPDVFELLGRPEFKYGNSPYYPTLVPKWSPLIKELLLEMKNELYEKLRGNKFNKTDGLTFQRRFWKTAQLVLIFKSVQSGEILYPLTLPAIKRGLANEGIPLPDTLWQLSDAYRNETQGLQCDISALKPYAIDYLKEIDP